MKGMLLWYWLLIMEGERVMGSTESSGERKLDKTPRWAVVGVSAVIIIISFLLEKVLHKLGLWFTERHKRALFEALDKIKADLMVLGFISLILTFGQKYIVGICIPTDIANTMLPCEKEDRRMLFSFEGRLLSSVSTAKICKEGHEPLISVEGLHELHILIFFLAVSHVVYSFVTMTLGRQKNVFQITHLLWSWYSFGLYSCFNSGFGLLITKLCLGVFILLWCSYITLPLYALVTQMGSRMKWCIFDEQTSKALKNWRLAAKNKRKIARKSPTRAAAGGSTSQSSTYYSTRSSFTHEDHDWSDLEAEPMTPTQSDDLIIRVDHDEQATTTEVSEISRVVEDDFSG